MFQVFQLTALVVRGPATHGEKLTITLDRVPIPDREVRDVLLFVLDAVRSSHFTQTSFFSELGVTMLSEYVAIADCITSSPEYAPWSQVETVCAAKLWLICMLAGTELACTGVLQRVPVSDGIIVAPLKKRHREGWECGSPMSWKSGVSNTCQLFLLLLVLLGPAEFVLPRPAQEEGFSKPPEDAPQNWACESSCNASEVVVVTGPKFWFRLGSRAFSWETASNWAGSTCRCIFRDGVAFKINGLVFEVRRTDWLVS